MKNRIVACIYEGQPYNIPYNELGRWNTYMISLSRIEKDCGQTQIEFSDVFSKYKVNNVMGINEIKKKLYKENPTAVFHNVRKDGIVYTTGFGENTITFLVPLTEIGDVVWEKEIAAKLLIRYIVNQ